MWISTRAQYGLRALIEIGRHHGETVSLRRAGFVNSVRRANSYQLARAPHDITAYEVVVMEGSIAPVACVERDRECTSADGCGPQNLWKRMDDALRDVLGSSTLQDLIREAKLTDRQRPI